MRCLVALASILFIAASCMECASADTPCMVVAERNCVDLWPNFPFGYVGCGATPCVNDECPANTEASGPLPEVYNETMDELDAQNENLAYYGPYETFNSPFDVPCRYKITCTLCVDFLSEDLCNTNLEYYHIDPLVDFFDERPVIWGESDCWWE